MKNRKKQNQNLSAHLALKITNEAKADIAEAQRQLERANRKLEIVQNISGIRGQIDWTYGKLSDVVAQLDTLERASIHEDKLTYPYLLDSCDSRADGYELGLFTPTTPDESA